MSYRDNSKWRPKGVKHGYAHKPFNCVVCGEMVYVIGTCGYCEHCEANYMMLDEDFENTVFSKKGYDFMKPHTYFAEFTDQTYFSEDDYELGVYPRENKND